MPAATVAPRRSPLLMTAVIIAVAIAAFFVFAAVWTEKLWFDSTGFTGVFTTQLIGQGVSGSRIAISGVGPDQPVASNSTAEGKAQNRRVTITLTPTA